ncbi:cupin domain-containing protein [Nocardioides daeguensis]|uniref:Cupin domain-containing protein n=1 Tax=Nocardioides daeguensis TaxID=908359 RepID=A0ABP6W9C4_9ACTN|nr:cupin domain-containing protein [Nocardioides daeguensis]MBV6727830.1 cupin domain-containing protein [Nocardioides daeguensis]MCR1775301.1 cupin domain-containing protein [Nocardioides daeguensis]
MESTSLTALAESQLLAAREASSGRAAVTVYGGREHRLRQTLVALRAGERLGEHDAPDEATLQVIEGEVAVHAGAETWRGGVGDHLVLPPQRHDLEALTDAAVLLTVAN